MLSGGQGGAVEYDRDGRRRGIGGIGGRRRDDRFAGPEALSVAIEAPETLGYRIKCRLLGPPTAPSCTTSREGSPCCSNGRRRTEGLDPGALVRVEGRVGERHGYLAMANPSYQILPWP